MKNIITLSTLLFSSCAFSQETSFSMNENNFTDFVIVQKEGKSGKDLYNKTIEWISRTYKNPESVILAKIENEYIRFEGVKTPFACKKILGSYECEAGRYQIEVSFKENKYKFDVVKIETYTKYNGYTSSGWDNFNMEDTSFYYKKGKIRPMYSSYPESFSKNINEINQSLSDYISGDVNASTKDW